MRVFFLTVFLLLVLALGALEAIASRSLPIDPSCARRADVDLGRLDVGPARARPAGA